MTNANPCILFLLFLTFIVVAAEVTPGLKIQPVLPYPRIFTHTAPSDKESQLQGTRGMLIKGHSRRSMIGSVAPTCTYNECRGCKYKCRAEQVPVEGNDPIHSPYHYKCVCHR